MRRIYFWDRLLPTVLDAIGVAVPEGVNGTSRLPVLRGETQAGCEQVFTQFHQTSGRRNYPMRCVQNARFGYIFNPWSDGEREFRNESQNGRSWQAMKRAEADDPDWLRETTCSRTACWRSFTILRTIPMR